MNVSAMTLPTVNIFVQKPQVLSIPVEEIHVWRVMDVTEKQKALRFRSETNQACSIVNRGMLRTILSWYLDMKPASIGFYYSVQGKPCLAAGHRLEFSVTHSNDVIPYSIVADCQVGIDVEHEGNVPELYDLAFCFFLYRELDLLTPLSDLERRKTFFKFWTLREAYAKRHYNGLIDEWRNVNILPVLEERYDLTVEIIDPLPEYAAALIVEESVHKIVHFNAFRGIAS